MLSRLPGTWMVRHQHLSLSLLKRPDAMRRRPTRRAVR
ncbi:hypothetical protein AXX16_3939 [Serratia rubidaea]|nr:hypothetical protein AXX16_3939 [Serratia rubidaea]